jgi:hypothetical protein
MRNATICICHPTSLNVHIKEDKMGGANFVLGREEKCIEGSDGNS